MEANSIRERLRQIRARLPGLGDRARSVRADLPGLAERLRRPPSPRTAGVLAAGLVVAATAIGLLLGGDAEVDRGAVPEAGNRTEGERRTSFLARIIPPAPENAPPGEGVAESVTELTKRLPADRKVAQLFLVGFQGQDLNAPVYRQLRRLDLGGLVIDRQNYTDPQQLALLAGEAGVIARQEKHVPPWVMASQEGGDFNQLADLPPPTAPSDLRSVEQAALEAREAGRALKPLGVNGLLAPVVDVGLVEDVAIGARAFSDDPELVASYARTLVQTYREAGVFAAVKHFPGLGSASQSPEIGPANVGLSLQELRERDLVPFRAAIAAGAAGVVLSNALYAPDNFVTPGSLSPAIATDLLRKELDFEGVAITDDLADPAVTALGSVSDSAVDAIKAGADMLYISGSAGDQQAAYVAVLRAVRGGEISKKRLDEAVLRILAVKRDYGLIR